MVNHFNTFYTVANTAEESLRLVQAFFKGEDCPNECPEIGRNDIGYRCECVTYNELTLSDFEPCACGECNSLDH